MLTLKNEFVGNETRLQLLYIFFLKLFRNRSFMGCMESPMRHYFVTVFEDTEKVMS